MKLIIIGTLPSSLYNFRGKLIQCFVGISTSVKALASGATTNDINSVEQLGAEYVDYPVSRSGLNPAEDFKTFKALGAIFKAEKPDVILAYTIKPIIWGGGSCARCARLSFLRIGNWFRFRVPKRELEEKPFNEASNLFI